MHMQWWEPDRMVPTGNMDQRWVYVNRCWKYGSLRISTFWNIKNYQADCKMYFWANIWAMEGVIEEELTIEHMYSQLEF